MLSLFLRNLFFTVLQPGIVVGLVPFFLLAKHQPVAAFTFYHYSAVLLFVIGFVLMLLCIISFAMHGKGTLSPADPTKKLVISGLYRFSRNPMYVGVMLMLIGEAIFFQSALLGIYATIIFIAFNIFIIGFEEPRLRNDFGTDYDKYASVVHRWL